MTKSMAVIALYK